jgi:LysR family transcriptional regulator, hydrogen peroxide-inducible genes activator
MRQKGLIGKDFVPMIAIGGGYTDMEIHQLRYFVAVAEEKSFSRAAEKVRVAQPSLSQQIQKLESELGRPLFDRLARSVILTEAGSGFLPYAQRILSELSSAQRYVSDRSDTPSGEVTVGILPTIAPFVVESLLARSAERFPELRLNIVEDVTDSLVKMVDTGEVDIAIISTCRSAAGAHIERWASEPLIAALPKSHRLAGHDAVTWRELQRETVLVLPESHCLSRQIHKWCQQHRLRDKRVGALQLATLLAMVSAGRGISLVPKMGVKKWRTGEECAFLPFKGVEPKREINLLRNSLHYQSKAATVTAEAARQVLCEAIGEK